MKSELEIAKAIVNKRVADSRDAYTADLKLVDDIAKAIREAREIDGEPLVRRSDAAAIARKFAEHVSVAGNSPYTKTRVAKEIASKIAAAIEAMEPWGK